MILPFRRKSPKIHNSVFVAPGARVIGDVRVEKDSSVWFNAVLRADIAPIRIGKRSNVQDGAVIHVDFGRGCVLGDDVTMGHQATAHACVLEEGVLLGMGATVLSRARVGAWSLIGAGAVVREGARIPPGSLVAGVPGRVIRRLTPAEIKGLKKNAHEYVKLSVEFRRFLG